MRKLKVINSYTDKELAKNMIVGFEFKTSEERAKVLIDKDFCIYVTEEVEIERGIVIVEKPKQTRKRKK